MRASLVGILIVAPRIHPPGRPVKRSGAVGETGPFGNRGESAAFHRVSATIRAAAERGGRLSCAVRGIVHGARRQRGRGRISEKAPQSKSPGISVDAGAVQQQCHAQERPLPHHLHFLATLRTLSPQSLQVFISGPGGAGFSLRMALVIMKTMNEMIAKSMMLLMKMP